MKLTKTVAIFIVFAFLFAPICRAETPDMARLVTLVEQMQKQIGDMQKVIDSQGLKLSELERKQAVVQISALATGGGTGTAQASMSDKEFNDRLNGALGGSNKWLKDLKFGGDLRLRYEAFANKGTSPDADRNRFRFRLRYGFEKKFGEEMKVGFSIASGEKVTGNGHSADVASANQTLGNDFDLKNVWIEKAYGQYNPKWAKVGPVDGVEIAGGKFANPFERGTSELIFDRSVRPEGAYEKANFKLFEGQKAKASAYVTAGQFVLQESATIGKDAQMFGYQVGVNPVFDTPFMKNPADLFGAVSYYDYQKYDRQASWKIDQANQSLANGNSVCTSNDLCTGYKVFDYYGELTIIPYKFPIRPFTEFAHNMRAGRSMRDRNAYTIGTKLGKLTKKGDWEAGYEYRFIGADSTPGAFADNSFGYRGGAGNKGHVFKLGYNVTDNLTLNGAMYLVRNLNIGQTLDPTTTSGQPIKSEEQWRCQLDTVWKF